MIGPPNPLPRVSGKGAIATGFRAVFEFCNQLREFCISIAPHSSYGVKVKRTPWGTSYVATPGTGDGRDEPATPEPPRWA
jgi:hypothetical protein